MTRDLILALVRDNGALTTEQLMAKTGFSYDKIHNSVKRLVKAGKLVRLADSKAYGVVGKVPATTASPVLGPSRVQPLAAPAFAPQQPRRIVNRFIVVLDKSSSMEGIRNDALAGINNTFDEIREQAFKTGQETTVSYYEFANRVERQFGIPEGNCMEWENSVRGNEEARAARSLGIEHYAVSRAAGQTRVENFYVKTDLSHLKTSDVKNALKDIRSEVKVWTVPAETDIKPFIEQRSGQPYIPGTAFYELTKSEDKIQPYKKLLVMEKDHRNVYAGDQARQVLQLPLYGNVKVKPGNHGNFNVFVQSTSVNRKLVRGTQVVFWPGAVR